VLAIGPASVIVKAPEGRWLPVFHLPFIPGTLACAGGAAKKWIRSMAKKKKGARADPQTELKTLESKWLKERRMDALEPIQVKVLAAKVAALVEFIEQKKLPVDVTIWPLAGVEELVKLDEEVFKQGLTNLQRVGVLSNGYKFRKVAAEDAAPEAVVAASSGGLLTYRCLKPGGVNLPDRDEYVLEDQEVTYSEEAIAASPSLQAAIANEWLVPMDGSAA
jgi:hypothetical protein